MDNEPVDVECELVHFDLDAIVRDLQWMASEFGPPIVDDPARCDHRIATALQKGWITEEELKRIIDEKVRPFVHPHYWVVKECIDNF